VTVFDEDLATLVRYEVAELLAAPAFDAREASSY
jgi:hypothetical protein